MRNLLFGIIIVIDLLANLPYILDSLKGKTKPNLASWSTWTLVNAIVAIAALSAGDAMNTVILAASYLVGSTAILLIAVFKGTRKYTMFDGVCQALALTGVVLWQLADNPNIALLFAILVDAFAMLPTLRHAYFHPWEETWITFAIASFGAFALLAFAESANFASLAFPIEAGIVCGSIAIVTFYRRKRLAAPS